MSRRGVVLSLLVVGALSALAWVVVVGVPGRLSPWAEGRAWRRERDAQLAWEKAGFETVWYVEDRKWGHFSVHSKPEGLKNARRSYQPRDPQQFKALPDLPDHPKPFALCLPAQVPPAELAKLGRFKNLAALVLPREAVTDDVLRVLREAGRLHLLAPLTLRQLTNANMMQVKDGSADPPPSGPQEIRSISLEGTPVTDAGLKELRDFTALTSLKLSYTKVTDTGLKEIAGLSGLTVLDLGGTQVTDAGMADLSTLKGLTTLSLYHAPVTDSGIEHLAALKELTALNLRGTRVTARGLTKLAGLRKLNSLLLEDSDVTDAVFQALGADGLLHTLTLAHGADGARPAGPQDVRGVHLRNTRVTVAGIKELKAFTGLRVLSLPRQLRVTDEVLRTLREVGLLHVLGEGAGGSRPTKLDEVARFSLGDSWVTDDGLKELQGMVNLTTLHLHRTGVGDAGLKHLAQFKKLSSLDLFKTQVSDRGLNDIKALTALTHLDIRYTHLTEAGARTLRSALPACKVVATEKDR